MPAKKTLREPLPAEVEAVKKVAALKKAIEELGFKVEETEEGLRVSQD